MEIERLRGSLLLVGIVDGPQPRADFDMREQSCLGERIAGGDLARRLERRGLDHDQASVHGLPVLRGEGAGKHERLAEALEIGEMLRPVRHADGEAVGLVGADQRVNHVVPPASGYCASDWLSMGASPFETGLWPSSG